MAAHLLLDLAARRGLDEHEEARVVGIVRDLIQIVRDRIRTVEQVARGTAPVDRILVHENEAVIVDGTDVEPGTIWATDRADSSKRRR